MTDMADAIKVLERVDSLDSIDSVTFLVSEFNRSVMAALEEDEISEFKRRELEGSLLPEPLLMADKSRFVLL